MTELPLYPPCSLDELPQNVIDSIPLDPYQHNQLMKQIKADDKFHVVSSRRGLLILFKIEEMVLLNEKDDKMQIQVPEMATVGYLKRRIVKAKLRQGHYLDPRKFILKRNCRTEGETLPEPDPNDVMGGEFLLNLGFYAGHTYTLTIASKIPAHSNDQQQQEKILTGQIVESGEDPEREAYRRLLKGSNVVRVSPTKPQPPVASTSPQEDQRQSPLPNPTVALSTPTEDGRHPPLPNTTSSGKKRRTKVRWEEEEVAALLKGVERFGASRWAAILREYQGRGISKTRTQVDLKDKWRNMVRVASDPVKGPKRFTQETRILIARKHMEARE